MYALVTQPEVLCDLAQRAAGGMEAAETVVKLTRARSVSCSSSSSRSWAVSVNRRLSLSRVTAVYATRHWWRV